MGLFGNTPKAGGFMDVIRCDEPSYLIWKWHPKESEQGNNNRENAIRWGSSLRVKDGEVAVFVYNQPNGLKEDFIEGPFDAKLETDNLPIIASLIGLAYDGGTPFQAEVYFINMAGIIQIPFGVPYFDIFDSRFPDFGVPTAVRGSITFNIADYREFIALHRMASFEIESFKKQIRDAVVRYVKNIVTNAPEEMGIPVVQIERKIADINEAVEVDVRERLETDFAVNVVALDINAIEIDKSSQGYLQLKKVTQDLTVATVQAQTEIDIKNMRDMQRITVENTEENLRIQREEAQYAQRKQTQMSNFAAYQLEQQAEVGIAGAKALGQMGLSGATEVSGGGAMNPTAIMTGTVMGGVVAQNVAGMMNGMMGAVNIQQNPLQYGSVPPPIPVPGYHVVINSQAAGPFEINALSKMVEAGVIQRETLVWRQGFKDWVKAESINELVSIFNNNSGMPSAPEDIPPIPQ